MLLACLLSGALAAEPVNLIRDGDFAEAPDPAGVANEHHLNADIWQNPSIPGWTLIGCTLDYVKVPNVRLLNIARGRASQSIATIPGRSYRVTFDVIMNSEYRVDTAVVYRAGKKNGKIPVQGGRSYKGCWFRFQASDNTTEVSFSGQGAPGGPRIRDIRCVEFDPSGQKVQALLEPVYRDMDRAEKNEKDLEKLTSLLTDDFTYQPLQGHALDRAGYENLMRQHYEKRFKVNSEIVASSQKEDNLACMEVERRESLPGDYGRLETRAPHFLHTWVKLGGAWKLRSAQEMADP